MADILWFLSSLVLVFLSVSMTVNGGVPAIFILGDSTADVGTNNHLQTFARADYLYNGIDFPGGSKQTGRFSNGLNSVDSLAQNLGFGGSPPLFLHLMTTQKGNVPMHILGGVNFASGASGLLDKTGPIYGEVIPFSNQTQQFLRVRAMLTDLFGKGRTDHFISGSLFIISVGSNDLLEYFGSTGTFSKVEFIVNLTSTYEYHLKTLYSLGARKFGIISPPPIGCCPSQRVKNTTGGGCLEGLNEYSKMFHSSLRALLKQMSSEFKDMKYSLGNAYAMVANFMKHPSRYGFMEVKYACCGNGTYNGENLCTIEAKLCHNRHEYLFWDRYHPTQAASHLAAKTLYDGAKRFVAPINFKQLADL